MKQLLNTLFVFTQGSYLRLEGNTLCVEVEKEKKLQVPLHHLGSIVSIGDVMMTPALIHRCAEDGRTITLLDGIGRFKARIEGAVSGNIILRQSQYRAAFDNGFALRLAKSFIAGKLNNSRQVLMRGMRESNNEEDTIALAEGAKLLLFNLNQIEAVSDLDVLRGIEGESARVYFSVIDRLVKREYRETFRMSGRSRRPPLDRFNALLSFLYVLLMSDCRSAVEGVGLDPQQGFLHAVRPGRPALALDLVEEFRSAIADRLALTLVNRGQLRESDFEMRDGGAVYLNESGRKTVVSAFQSRKQEELTHPLIEQSTPIGLLPHVQARLLARTLRGEMGDYLPFIWK